MPHEREQHVPHLVRDRVTGATTVGQFLDAGRLLVIQTDSSEEFMGKRGFGQLAK